MDQKKTARPAGGRDGLFSQRRRMLVILRMVPALPATVVVVAVMVRMSLATRGHKKPVYGEASKGVKRRREYRAEVDVDNGCARR